MSNEVLVGIDIGSTNVKTVIFDTEFRVLASETQEYTTLIPKPGWTEYQPEEWWDCVKNTLNRAIKNAQVEPKRIAGIGLSSLGCCPVPMDEKLNVVYNGIPWSDQRAQDEVKFLIDKCKDSIYKACKNIPTTMNATPHLMWIKDKAPEVYKKIYKYSEPSGYLGAKFTDEVTLDFSFASSLDFGFDLRTLAWDEKLIKQMKLDVEKYPRLHRNTEQLGKVTEKAAKETGIVAGIPVFAGGPDFTPGAVGAGAIRAGQGYYSMGSGANMIVLTDDQEVASPYLISIIHAKGPQLRMLDGVQGSIGYSIRWFRDQLGGLEQQAAGLLKNNLNAFDIITAEGLGTDPGAGGLVYLPYLFGKFHPVLNPDAKGVFFGIAPTTTRAQFIRAVMEGCSYDMYQSLKSSLNLGIKVNEIIATGGPSKSNLWCQIMADVTNTKIVTVTAPEAAPFGDAVIAGIGTGLFPSFESATEKAIKVDRVFQPNERNHRLYEELFGVYEEVYDSLYDKFAKLGKIKEKYGITR
jgi:xylulokinase